MISSNESKQLLEFYNVLSKAIRLYLENDENDTKKILSIQVQKIILIIIKYIKELGIIEEKIYTYLSQIDKMILDNMGDKDKKIEKLLSMIYTEIEKIEIGEPIYENLYMEDNIEKYLDILEQAYQNNLIILISAFGTPCYKNDVTRQMSVKLQNLGLKENLSNWEIVDT